MKNAVTRILLSGVTMLLLACAQVPPDENGDGIVESAQQPDDAKLVFSSLELDRTNRGSININGYDRHFSVTFPTSYDNNVAYPVVLFFHGCMCRPSFTEQFIKSYLDWKPRLDSYKDDFITISENVLVGVRIKDCGHRLTADQYQSDFLRIFSQQNGDLSEYDSAISRDTAMTFCQ